MCDGGDDDALLFRGGVDEVSVAYIDTYMGDRYTSFFVGEEKE